MWTYAYSSLIGTGQSAFVTPRTVLCVNLLFFFRDRWRKKETKWRQIVYSEWVRAREHATTTRKMRLKKNCIQKELVSRVGTDYFFHTHTKSDVESQYTRVNRMGWLLSAEGEPALSKLRFYDGGHHVSFFIMLMNYPSTGFSMLWGSSPPNIKELPYSRNIRNIKSKIQY